MPLRWVSFKHNDVIIYHFYGVVYFISFYFYYNKGDANRTRLFYLYTQPHLKRNKRKVGVIIIFFMVNINL